MKKLEFAKAKEEAKAARHSPGPAQAQAIDPGPGAAFFACRSFALRDSLAPGGARYPSLRTEGSNSQRPLRIVSSTQRGNLTDNPGWVARRPLGHENPGKTGAGEGIRTLDPNLGKVVLYP